MTVYPKASSLRGRSPASPSLDGFFRPVATDAILLARSGVQNDRSGFKSQRELTFLELNSDCGLNCVPQSANWAPRDVGSHLECLGKPPERPFVCAVILDVAFKVEKAIS